jgi:uncharacterized protein (DUF1499 family)
MNALRLFPLLAALAAAAVVASGFGARFGVWDWRAGFTILRWGTYASLGIAALALVALLVPKLRARGSLGLAIALLLAGGAAAVPLYWLQQARAVPPINDVTTDPGNPPAFVAILPLRADAPVPAAYPGEATASAQRNAYPDLVPIVVPRPPAAAFDAALAAARSMGWTIVAADAASGRIEATATTPWFGFRDDVVIRVAPDARGSRVDVRSVSRVGKSDLGANARRVREYSAIVAGKPPG